MPHLGSDERLPFAWVNFETQLSHLVTDAHPVLLPLTPIEM
jgi:hypothetical protein